MDETSEERTFKAYSPTQAAAYAAQRDAYDEKLFQKIIDHHRVTGGSFGVLLDVGCGPGNSTRPLAKHFDDAYGLDPSPQMISTAQAIGAEAVQGETATGSRIEFVVGRAEDMAPLRESGRKVDLLISAMAAHWFDMPRFWASAADLVNEGGTVALWTRASLYCHPSTPNAALVQDAIFRLEREHLLQYELPGNRLSREGYQNLPLPWTVDPPITGFPQAGFSRVEWDRDGHLTDPYHFFLGDKHLTLAQIGKQLGTASMVTRWREAHPQQAGTEEDVVNFMLRDLRKTLGRDNLVIGASCHLLLFKRQ